MDMLMSAGEVAKANLFPAAQCAGDDGCDDLITETVAKCVATSYVEVSFEGSLEMEIYFPYDATQKSM
jgi:hypothetical protein